MNQSQLAHVLLPLGVLTKISVRKLAEKYELTVSKKKESQDICFITDGVSDFLKDKTSYKQGNIVLKDGTIVGKHSGLPFYTIGQRKGLGGGFNRPMYIISLDKEKNRITVGGEKDLLRSELIMKRISWISDIPPKLPFSCMGKVRYQNNETNCTIIDSPNGFAVKFAKPQKAITPGQSVVFYFKDEVIGGGIIEA
jgi:tRNA-specific 2-thiouridylase